MEVEAVVGSAGLENGNIMFHKMLSLDISKYLYLHILQTNIFRLFYLISVWISSFLGFLNEFCSSTTSWFLGRLVSDETKSFSIMLFSSWWWTSFSFYIQNKNYSFQVKKQRKIKIFVNKIILISYLSITFACVHIGR